MDIILNKIAIWKPCGAKKLSCREHPLGQTYFKAGSPVCQKSLTPLYRYAKDYKIDKVQFSLFVRTNYRDDRAVGSALDSYAKQITKEQALAATQGATFIDFVYTDFYIKEGS